MVQAEGAEGAGHVELAAEGSRPAGRAAGDGAVRLTVPAEADFVAVVRLTVQAVSARAGCSDDARSRLRAAAGTAFFEAAADAGADGAVLVELRTDGALVVVELTAVPAGGGPTRGGSRSIHVVCEHPPRPAG